jgi:ribosomal protein L2
MPATIFPATLGFTWGIPTAEAGIAVESVRQNNTVQVFEQKNNVGEDIAIVTYNPKAEITIAGETTATFADTVGTKITVANILTLGGVPAGLIICRAIEFTQGREAMQKVSMTATMYPLIPAT